MIQVSDSIAHIAIKQPSSVEVFDRAGIEYCCHGGQSLAEASSGVAASPEEISRALVSAGREAPDHGSDWTGKTCEFLILRVLRQQHADLRDGLRNLRILAADAAERNGSKHAELRVIRDLVEELSVELGTHMDAEESTVFPALLEVELAYLVESFASMPRRLLDAILKSMSVQHRVAGRTLGQLRRESNGFCPPARADGKYQEFFGRLRELYIEVRHDLHVENNVLFPRVMQMEAELTSVSYPPSTDPDPKKHVSAA